MLEVQAIYLAVWSKQHKAMGDVLTKKGDEIDTKIKKQTQGLNDFVKKFDEGMGTLSPEIESQATKNLIKRSIIKKQNPLKKN